MGRILVGGFLVVTGWLLVEEGVQRVQEQRALDREIEQERERERDRLFDEVHRLRAQLDATAADEAKPA